MEAAETLARQLQLPELVATVASYLDGSDSNAVDPCLRAERDFTMALFLFTGNVRIVVYYTRLQYMPRYDLNIYAWSTDCCIRLATNLRGSQSVTPFRNAFSCR